VCCGTALPFITYIETSKNVSEVGEESDKISFLGKEYWIKIKKDMN
jgi:hypothetical protein